MTEAIINQTRSTSVEVVVILENLNLTNKKNFKLGKNRINIQKKNNEKEREKKRSLKQINKLGKEVLKIFFPFPSLKAQAPTTMKGSKKL